MKEDGGKRRNYITHGRSKEHSGGGTVEFGGGEMNKDEKGG